jgi:hypothetical protein
MRKRQRKKVKIAWVRMNDNITFTVPNTWFCPKLRGEAKSTFLERVGMNHMEKGTVLFDLFASRDGENLAWLRSPYAKEKDSALERLHIGKPGQRRD